MDKVLRIPLDVRIRKYSHTRNRIVANVAALNLKEYMMGTSRICRSYIHEYDRLVSLGWEDVESMAQFLQKLETAPPDEKEEALYKLLLEPYAI